MAVDFRQLRTAVPVQLKLWGDVELYLDNPSLAAAQRNGRVQKRLRWITAPLALVFGLLFARLWQLQIATCGEHGEQARLNRLRTIPVPPPRGVLFDRNGATLVTSVAHYRAALVPAEVRDAETTFSLLAKILRLNPRAQNALSADHRSARGYVPVPIKRALSAEEVAALEENRVRLPGIIVEPELVRHYTRGSFAAHVLGYVGEVSPDELSAPEADRRLVSGDVTGKLGIERKYNRFLLGEKGSLLVETDARGNPIGRVGQRDERTGSSLSLTLDARLQREAEAALAAAGHAGAVIVMRVDGGEVLAIASFPTFDPNLFSTPVSPQVWRELAHDEDHPMLNRAATSRYPPGSTFKTITAAAGLDLGLITPTSTVVCDGVMTLGREFKCAGRHGPMTLSSALAKSCNVYFMTIGRKIGERRLAEYARRFGLGGKTGIDLPRESVGLVPDAEWKQERTRERWYPGDTLNMSIGQGFVLATPLQMACALSAVANGGRLPTPRLLREVRAPNGEVEERGAPRFRSVGVMPRGLALIRQGMRQAVLEGTCRSLNTPVVTVGAKTGSSQNLGTKTHAWIAAFAPFEQPEIACVVLLENAGHGGEVAAPVARRVLEAAFSKSAPTTAIVHFDDFTAAN